MTKIILAGVVSCLFSCSAHLPAVTTPAVAINEPAVLFAVYEGPRINLYSSHLDSSNKKLLLSQETKLTNARPADVMAARVSPDSRRIAYKLPGFGSVYGPAPLFVMDRNGENKTKIVDQVQDFRWGISSNDIIYAAPLPPPDPMHELSFHEDGFEWHRLDLQTGKDETVAVPGQKLHRFGAWINGNQALFISYRLESPLLYILDLTARSTTPFELPLGLGNPELSASSVGGRIVISAADTTHACVFYEVDVKDKTVKKLFAGHDRCEGMAWNGNDEFFYGVWLSLAEGKTSESGYYALGSVYKYDFQSRRRQAVLLSSGKEIYRFEGVVPGRALIVSNEANRRSPPYILEIRDLKRNQPVTLLTSGKEMLFLGYLP